MNKNLCEPIGRRLGATEELFWLVDQTSPAQFCIAAEMDGAVDPRAWRRALDDVQKRHPLLNMRIDPETRAFRRVDAPIPLRIETGEDASWPAVVRFELATPFGPDAAPLLRAVLLPRPDATALVLTAHHAMADGLSLAFVLRDLLAVLAGTPAEPLALVQAQEQAFGHPVAADAVPLQAAGHRDPIDPAPGFTRYRVPEGETAAILAASRAQGATVQGALCAAVAVAGRACVPAWQDRDIRLISPVSTRALAGADAQCALHMVPSMLDFPRANSDDFWAMARGITEHLREAALPGNVAAALGGMGGLMASSLDAASMRGFMLANFRAQGMVSNLGNLPFETRYGPLTLKSLWGPAVLMLADDEQIVGALTFAGALHLTHSSHAPAPGLLEAVVRILKAAST